MRIIVCSVSQMASEGVLNGNSRVFFETVGLKGDWKFHRQACNLTRHYGTNAVCYWCGATKDMSNPMTNLDLGAPWRNNLFDRTDPPWNVCPSVASLRNFTTQLILPDLLHVWHLGSGRDFLGSCLLLMIRERGYFEGRNQSQRFKSATRLVVEWSRQHNKPMALPRKWRLSKKKLNMKSGEYASLRDKGARTVVVLEWLAAQLSQNPFGDFLMESAVSAANVCLMILGTSRKRSAFLTNEERDQVQVVGRFFLLCYYHLYARGPAGNYYLFHIRPKLHLLDHILALPFGNKNPSVGLCWMDEDFLRKLMAILKRTHVSTSPISTIRQWLLGLKQKFDDVLDAIEKGPLHMWVFACVCCYIGLLPHLEA